MTWASLSKPAAGATALPESLTAASSRRSCMRPAPATSTPRACCWTPGRVNQVPRYGWSALLAATQNRNYELAKFLIEHGADVKSLTRAVGRRCTSDDKRNCRAATTPPHPRHGRLEYIELLLEGRRPQCPVDRKRENATVSRTSGSTKTGRRPPCAPRSPATSSDAAAARARRRSEVLTKLGVTPLAAAAGIGWVEGVTSERSTEQTVEAVKMLLELGVDPDYQAETGRTALHGAAHKGATEVVRILVAAGARMDIRDFGNTDNRGSPELAAHTWLPIDYADGLVRVGVQSAIAHPETAKVLRELMIEAGLEAPPEGRTLESICIVEVCSPDYNPVDNN